MVPTVNLMLTVLDDPENPQTPPKATAGTPSATAIITGKKKADGTQSYQKRIRRNQYHDVMQAAHDDLECTFIPFVDAMLF